MLYKSLHFKLVLILVLFIIIIISIIGTAMLNGVFDFYTKNFNDMMIQALNDDILSDLCEVMTNDNFYTVQQDRLSVEYGNLGITSSRYRNLYILDMDGNYLAGTNEELGQSLIKTRNMIAAMNKRNGNKQSFGLDYMDYAVYLSSDMYSGRSINIEGSDNADTETIRECIIYIKDTQEEMRNFSWKMFGIIIQVLLAGLGVAVILSFFFAKAITSPIQNITKGALKLADGDFKRKIEVASNDEIGTLSMTFNDMAEKLISTLDEVSSEREKLEITFSYLNDGVLVFSNEGKRILINPQGVEILKKDSGCYDDFDRFLDLFDLWAEEEEKHEKENKDKSEKNEKSENKNAGSIFRNVSYRDNIFDISIGKFKYTNDENQLNANKASGGTIVVIHDVTQSYALEKSRREFIANVSHELRTPLTSIIGAAETIAESKVSEDAKIRFLNMILSEGARMTGIVQDLLIVSRLDNKKMMWQFMQVKPEVMAANIYEAMRGEAEKNGQTLTLRTGKNIPSVYADKARIEQVLANIVSNAIKYTPENGKIEFSVEAYKIKGSDSGALLPGVKFIVKDNGFGIPKKDLPHIFERFYRVEKARSTEAGGTGLGLSIAKEIVQAHNGDIMVESVDGSGTVVTIILPQNNDNESKI